MYKYSRLYFFLFVSFLLVACGGEQVAEPEPNEPTATQTALPVEATVTQEPSPTPNPSPTLEPEPSPTATDVPRDVRTPSQIVAELPRVELDLISGTYIYSNGNYSTDIALYDGRLWLASDGGLTAFDLQTGESRQYTTLDGLQDNRLNSLVVCPVMAEDRLFIGSRAGLQVYDKVTDGFESGAVVGFEADSLWSVNEMACDVANGRLLIDELEIFILDLATKELTMYDDDTGLAYNDAKTFVIDGQDIWIPTGHSGVSHIQADGTINIYSEETGNLPTDIVNDLAIAPDGTLWLATYDGLYQRNNAGEFILFDRETIPDVIAFSNPEQIEILPNGDFWLIFSDELCLFDPSAQVCLTRYTADDLGLAFAVDIERVLFADNAPIAIELDHFGQEGFGAKIFDGNQWQQYQLENQIPENHFTHFFQDPEGNLWLFGSGHVYKTDVTAENGEELTSVYANDMAVDSAGSLWFASRNIYEYNGIGITEYTAENAGIHDATHYAMVITPEDVVYAGAYDGYTIIDGSTVTIVTEDEDGWPFGSINEMLYANGEVYAATDEALVTLDGASWTVLVDENTNINVANRVDLAALEILADDTLLLGSSQGLLYYKDGILTREETVEGNVSDIFVMPDGQIWLVSYVYDNGVQNRIYHFDGVSWQIHPVGDDLPATEPVTAVHVDNAGTVWVATNGGGGILRIVP